MPQMQLRKQLLLQSMSVSLQGFLTKVGKNMPIKKCNNENVLVSITSRQFYDDQNGDSMELITSGNFAERNGGYILTYKETDPDTEGATYTTVTTEPDGRVIVVREGEIQSQMIFEQGQKHIVHYDTNYGSLTVGVAARKVRTALDQNGGDINIEYAIEIDNSVASENRLNLNINKKGNPGARSAGNRAADKLSS